MDDVPSGPLSHNGRPPSTSDDETLVAEALALAASLASAALARRTPAQARVDARMQRMLDDTASRAFVLDLTDRVLRTTDRRAGARALQELAAEIPAVAGRLDRLALRAGAALAIHAPWLVMPLVQRRLAWETRRLVLPAHDPGLARALAHLHDDGFRTNVNDLGEAVLGRREAQRHLDAVVAQLRRPDVDYVSVKISSLCADLSILAFDASVDAIVDRLNILYRAAASTGTATFVNLDMEERADLDLTVEAFIQALDRPEHRDLSAGIVLQAYLPDSHAALDRLAAWAIDRRDGGGAPIKVRVVKGANLAMEQVTAEQHGWPAAPYRSKAEVDASYKRLLDRLFDPALDGAIRVGVASHNLFDVSWGLLAARRAGAEHRVELEMLAGMAPDHAAAVRDRAGSLLLYAPVADRSSFRTAIAYLARRLDENSGPDNFLRRLHALRPGSDAWTVEADRFRTAVADRVTVSITSRRQQDRSTETISFPPSAPFANVSDTDLTVVTNRRWFADHLERTALPSAAIPLVIDGESIVTSQTEASIDPSNPGGPGYRYVVADDDLVDRAVDAATSPAAAEWAARSPADRGVVLRRAAELMAAERGTTLAVMAHDAGKTFAEGDPEVSEAIDFALWYAACAERLANLGSGRLTARGPVLVVPPWNFPYAITAGGVLAALAAGNPIILKPAPETVWTASLLVDQLRRAGVPDAALQLVSVREDDTGRHLITHPGLDTVVLTGAAATASLFLDWRPSLRLLAETSGKNAIVVTEQADLDAAVRDVVASAFGHAGQKCSAASLLIATPGVFDDTQFRAKLVDATTTLRVGPATDLRTDVGPLIRPPDGALQRGLTRLDPGESWLVEPKASPENPHLWSPGIRWGVRPGAWFHRTECFGPVLGVLRADDLSHAIELQNATEFGLTGGIQTLDPAEVERWLTDVEIGNAYINRHITGAIVRRQPFGGWKGSNVGPSQKAGGPDQVTTMGRWIDGPLPTSERASTPNGQPTGRADPARAPGPAAALLNAWSTVLSPEDHGVLVDIVASWTERWAVFAQGVDPSGLRAEANVLERHALPAPVVLRCDRATPDLSLALAVIAGAVTGTGVRLSSPVPLDASVTDALRAAGVRVAIEDDAAFAKRIPSAGRLRALAPLSDDLRRLAHRSGVSIEEEPIAREPVVELPRWCRARAVSRTRHRYGLIRPDP